ncbi:class I SAM-dependent methyltransferase [Microbulbifer epialgicus]|uniref:Class I SAM-dependent methyltransferase n=1 Tax=Microbulbifer epialgicus TaxID=393907 RepID=A0ABV4P1A1_9GAMM
MRQNRRFVALNLDEDIVGHPTLLFSLSEEAQAFVSEIVDDTFSIRLSLDMEPDGRHRASLHGPPDLAELFASLNLQARCDIVADGYNVRVLDALDMDTVSAGTTEKIVEGLELQNGAKVLDLMCGAGEISQALRRFAAQNAMEIELSMCDAHRSQLERADSETHECAADITVGDARALPYTKESFDAVVLKMGLHEVPQADQSLVVQEIYRVLKPGGRFVIWELLPGTGEIQDAFTDIVHKSNMLARCESQAFDRYFPRGDQLLWLLKSAGFKNIEPLLQTEFSYSTLARLKDELAGDHSKLAILNNFTRERVSQKLRDEVHWQDSGDNITIGVPNCIFRADKPM